MATELLPLVLSVKAANWRMNDEASGEADTEFSHARLKALERDDRTCQFCGFRAPKWQEVHHRNDDHHDNRAQNLVTACQFCHMVQHIGLAGRNKEATLVWLPQIPQDCLHHVVRSILVVRQWADGLTADKRQRPEVARAARSMADAAEGVMSKLMEHEADAVKELGTSDPRELADILLQMPEALYAKRADFLYGIRLLPLGRRGQNGAEKMPEIIETWLTTGGPYANLNPRTWVSLLRQYVA